jgi:hypothetical protein
MENGEYVEKTSQDEVEQHTMAMCDGRFQLTENTPQMQDPMRSELGPLAVNSKAATAILNGSSGTGFDFVSGFCYLSSRMLSIYTVATE